MNWYVVIGLFVACAVVLDVFMHWLRYRRDIKYQEAVKKLKEGGKL